MKLMCAVLGHDWSDWIVQVYLRKRKNRGYYRYCRRCYMEEWR